MTDWKRKTLVKTGNRPGIYTKKTILLKVSSTTRKTAQNNSRKKNIKNVGYIAPITDQYPIIG